MALCNTCASRAFYFSKSTTRHVEFLGVRRNLERDLKREIIGGHVSWLFQCRGFVSSTALSHREHRLRSFNTRSLGVSERQDGNTASCIGLKPTGAVTKIIRKGISSTRALTQNDKKNENEAAPEKATQTIKKTTSQIAQKLTRNLAHENIYTLPNFLTLSRLIATPVIGYLILHDYHGWAVALFGYAGFTDLVDGWIARRWNQQTVVGSVVDPMADKALMTVITVCLTVHGTLPLWLATIILGRDVSLAIAAIYYRFASLPSPKTLKRYWDFSLPSAEVHPTGISKANTLLQLLLIGATTAIPIAAPLAQGALETWNAGIGINDIMTAAQYTVAATTTWSGLSYLWTRGAVKILGEKSADEKRRILIKGRMVLGVSFASCLGLSLLLVS